MKLKHIALIGAGTMLEIYDSYIVGFMLGIINENFFPESLHNNFAKIVAFSILFLIRPISAFFWGILGDRYGKLLVFKHAILFMALATLAIGLLPTYAMVGGVAPILLLSLRALQGISISGEFGSAVVLCYEQGRAQERFYRNGMLYVFIFSGILVANAMIYFIHHSGIPNAFAWRVPFVFGGVAGIGVYFLRRKFIVKEAKHPEVKLRTIFFNYKALLITVPAIFLINLNWFYSSAINVILGKYANSNTVNFLSLHSSIIVLLAAFIFGKYFAVRMHKNLLIMLSTALVIIYSISLILLNYHHFSFTTAMIVFYYLESVIAGMVFASLPVLILNYLPDEIHNSLYTIGNNISTAIIVGLMPFVANLFMQYSSQNWIHYLLVVNLLISLLSLVSIYCLKRI